MDSNRSMQKLIITIIIIIMRMIRNERGTATEACTDKIIMIRNQIGTAMEACTDKIIMIRNLIGTATEACID